MRSYESVLLPWLGATLYLLPCWILAAWTASHAARRKTRKGLKLTAWLGLFSLFILVSLNVYRLWLMVPMFQRGLGILPSTYVAVLVLHLLPFAMTLILGLPEYWRAIRMPRRDVSDDLDSDTRARLASARFAVPFQLGLAGAFLALFLTVAVPSIALVLVCLLGWLAFGIWRGNGQERLRAAIVDRGRDAIPRFWPRLARRSGMVVGFVVAVGVIVAVAWWRSYLPGQYSMNMSASAHAAVPSGFVMKQVVDFSGPSDGKPDRSFTLVAQQAKVKLSSGDIIDALTYNGQSPGPELRVRQGDLVEVTLQNRDISEGVTIHWHGINVPNREDGVAGLTQDAVMPGETYIYRFRANDSGSYWYHSHQHTMDEVGRGLFGALIVEPREAQPDNVAEVVVPIHGWPKPGGRGLVTTFGTATSGHRTIVAGTHVHLRLINMDIERHALNLTGTAFRVSAIDGVDVHEPDTLNRARMVLAAGGRYDVRFTMPNSAVRLSSVTEFPLPGGVQIPDGFKASLVLGPDEKSDIAESTPTSEFDPGHYGKSTGGTVNLQSHFDREYTYTFESGFGFMGRTFSTLYLINGETYPNIPSLVVHEGDLIKVTLINRWFEAHPIHPHGHRMLVLSHNGLPVSGSPWWTDTLNVEPGDTFEVALKADNPGLWMDHCHNLVHAAGGMVMHLMYDNVMTPFVAGPATRNNPE